MSYAAAWFRVDRRRSMCWRLAFGSILVVATSWEPARSQESRERALAGAPGGASLARYVPRQDLALFLEFDGLDAHAAAWRASAACKLLSGTSSGALLEDLGAQAIDLAQESVPPGSRIKGSELVELGKIFTRNGFVIAGWGKGLNQMRALVALRRGDRPEVRQLIESVAAGVFSRAGNPQEKNAPYRIAGRTLHPLGRSGTWWAEKGDLIFAARNAAEEVFAVIDGKQPSALDHPLRLKLTGAEKGFQAVAVGFVELSALGPPAPEFVQLGLDGLKRVELRWGFQGEALVTKLHAAAPAPRRGLLALFDQPAFGIGTLPPLPAGLTGFAVLSLDPVRMYDQFQDVAGLPNRERTAHLWNPDALARAGIDLRRDVLGPLGTRFALYILTAGKDETDNPAAMIASRCAGFTVSLSVRDHAAAARAIEPLIGVLNRVFREQQRVVRRNQAGPLVPLVASMNFRQEPGPHPEYVCTFPANTLPAPFSEAIQPTIALGPDQLVISGSKAAAERALAGGARWQPDEAFVSVTRRLPADMVYLFVGDLRNSTRLLTRVLPILVRQVNTEMALADRRVGRAPRDVYLRLDPEQIPRVDELNRLLFPSSTTLVAGPAGATLTQHEPIPTLTSPAASGILVALLLPALQSRREAARRAGCVNNLKQIALAMHNYHSANNAFPRPALADDKGKPLLSWRVAILPYLGEQELYNKFKMDDPWDSPHNKALLKEMPAVYLCKTRAKTEPFTTTYRMFTGKGALFENDQDIGIQDVTDGTSNTIMVVESADAVPWTKPEDLKFDPEAAPSLRGAGSPHPGGFNAAFADGAVRFLSNKINLDVFRALITRNGGEVINPGGF